METVQQDYSPLGQNVDEKDYASNLGSANTVPIPQPEFKPPSFENSKDFFAPDDGSDTKEKAQDQPQSGAQPKGSPSHREPIDPGFNELSGGEKKQAAEALAQSVLQGYGILCKQGGKWVMVKKGKVDRLINEGKIDPTVLYYDSYGTAAPAPEIIRAYNDQIADIVEVTPEFAEQVLPLMTRIFMKRGVGLTDEQQLLFLFGQDIAMKGAMLMSIKKESNNFLRSFTRENSTESSKPSGRTRPEQESAPDPSPSKAKPMVSVPKDEIDAVPQDVPAPPKTRVPKKRTAQKDPGLSPTLEENAPEGFFSPVDIDAKMAVPEFGNKEKLDFLEQAEKAHKERLKQQASSKKNKEPKKKKSK